MSIRSMKRLSATRCSATCALSVRPVIASARSGVKRSAIDVARRKSRTSTGCRLSTSASRYSDAGRPSKASDWSTPESVRTPSYESMNSRSPAAQPSVRTSSVANDCESTSSARPSRSSRASSGVNARSRARSSVNSPLARRRCNGSIGSCRVDSTSRNDAGAARSNSSSVDAISTLWTVWKSSIATTIAVSHSAQNDASPSRRRGASHATLGGSMASHDERSDVLPKPAGAESSVSGPRVPVSRRSRSRFRTTSGRGGEGMTRSAAATASDPRRLFVLGARWYSFLPPATLDASAVAAQAVDRNATRKTTHTFRVRLCHPATFDGDDGAVQPV